MPEIRTTPFTLGELTYLANVREFEHEFIHMFRFAISLDDLLKISLDYMGLNEYIDATFLPEEVFEYGKNYQYEPLFITDRDKKIVIRVVIDLTNALEQL